LQVSDEQLEWIVPILKDSHQDELTFHSERLKALRERYDTLDRRIGTIYEDKLDGKIPEELWFRKNEEYKREMAQINESLRQHEKGNFDYVESGIELLNLAKDAYRLYSERNAMAQRRLISVVLLNCKLKGGQVDYDYYPPFDLLATLSKVEKKLGRKDSNL
jgi:site-specific DNA recombinase